VSEVKVTTAAQLRFVSVNVNTRHTVDLTHTQQKAVDKLVDQRIGKALHDLTYEVSDLISQLLTINTKE